jgi:hypothetical protein
MNSVLITSDFKMNFRNILALIVPLSILQNLIEIGDSVLWSGGFNMEALKKISD